MDTFSGKFTPVHKKDLHNKLIFCYERHKELQESLFGETLTLNSEKINTIVNEIRLHEIKMNEFSSEVLLSEN